MAELRWENFGVRQEDASDLSELRLSLPRTSSLLRYVELSECGGLNGLGTLCLQSAGLLNHVLTRVFDDWDLLVQADEEARRDGKSFPLDLGRVHNMTKRESIPDVLTDDDSRYVSYPLTLGGELSRDLRNFAQGLEVGGANQSFEIGLNLHNLQLCVQQRGGRLVLSRDEEHEEVPAP